MRGSISIALRYSGTASSSRPMPESEFAKPKCAIALCGSSSIERR